MKYPSIQNVFHTDGKPRRYTPFYTEPAFDYLKDCPWICTEKVDGTNTRLHWDGEKLHVGGRTDDAQIRTDYLDMLTSLLNPTDLALNYDHPITFYGEAYGPNVQSGGKYRDTPGFVLFDVLVGEWWLERSKVEKVATQWKLDVVPIVFEGPLVDAVQFVRDGFYSVWSESRPSFYAEGLVCIPKVELKTRRGDRIQCKIKGEFFDH